MFTRTSTLWQMTLMAFQYLRGRKLRTALTTLAIVFGVALIFAINITLPSALEAFRGSVTGASGAVDLTIASVSRNGFAPAEVLEKVAAVDGVQAVTGSLRRQITIPTVLGGDLGSSTQLDLQGIDPATASLVRPYLISEGRFLEPDDTGKAVIPAALAELSNGLKIGDSFPLITAKGLKVFTIVGYLAESINPNAPNVIIPLRDAQGALQQPGLVNQIDVAFKPGANREQVIAAVQTAVGDGFALNADNDQSDILGALQVGFGIFNLMGALALFLGAFLIFNTFRAVILERRHDLAMLRAIGATRIQITQMIVIESLVQGAIGTLIGMVLGYTMAMLIGLGAEGYIAQYMPGLKFTPQINVGAVVGTAAIGLLTALIAGYLPARTASRISPLEALRPSPVADVKRTARWGLILGVIVMGIATVLLVSSQGTAPGGAVLFLVGMLLAAPGLVIPLARLFSPLLSLWFAREGDLAQGNLTREPGRAAITASTLMIGLASLIMIFALVSSMGKFVTDLTNRTFASDIAILPPSIAVYQNVVGADESLATSIRALPDVATVAGLRYGTTQSNGQALEVLGIEPQTYSEFSSITFAEGEPEAAYAAMAAGRGTFITSITASTLGVKLGDTLLLETPNGQQPYQVVGIANDILTFKLNAIYISQSNLAADFNKAEDVLLMVNVKPGADKAAVLTQIQGLLEAYPQFTASLAGEYRETLIQTTNAAFYAFYVIGIMILIPAALGVLNTLTINILERRREIGMVRAVGGSKRQIQRIVTAEALLLGLFGAACGVLAGVAMSYGFITAFDTIGWQMPYFFPTIGIIAAVVIGVLITLFASILPARNAARLDIIRALQFE
jgi:putative ABC transport system permease protein